MTVRLSAESKAFAVMRVLEEEFPPVLSAREIARRAGLSYGQTTRALNHLQSHWEELFDDVPIARVGNLKGFWYYSVVRCSRPVSRLGIYTSIAAIPEPHNKIEGETYDNFNNEESTGGIPF